MHERHMKELARRDERETSLKVVVSNQLIMISSVDGPQAEVLKLQEEVQTLRGGTEQQIEVQLTLSMFLTRAVQTLQESERVKHREAVQQLQARRVIAIVRP